MFENIKLAPADPILGLTDAFRADTNPLKINLGVGIYQDQNGKTTNLLAVTEAEALLLKSNAPKTYLAIEGGAAYGTALQKLLLGEGHPLLSSGRVKTAQSPGGTGALRIAADFLAQQKPGTTVWFSDPTWANHHAIFKAAGIKTDSYRYFDAAINGIDFDGLCAALRKIPAGDVVVFHACCHNPSGADPSHEQWKELAKIQQEVGFGVLFDFAYQGFGKGIEEDAIGIRTFADVCDELLVASSFSKNFGLYNERVGALSMIAKSAEEADAAFSQIRVAIRCNYSNPPSHGAGIVATILNSPELRKMWENELAAMRQRIAEMRSLFVKTLADAGATQDFSFIEEQVGMFSFSGLNKTQVDRLKKDYAIYIVGSGRINVAGMNQDNLPRLCQAIVEVL